MVPKFAIFLFLSFLKHVHSQESVSKKVSSVDIIQNALVSEISLDHCLSIVQEHWLLEIIEAVKALNDTITSVDTIKQEIVAEIKTQITQTQDLIITEHQKWISESERTILDQLSIEKEAIITENKNLATAVEENLKNELAAIKGELIVEISDVKNLQEVNKEAIDDIHIRNPVPTDCKDLQTRGATSSGVYRIKPRAATDDFLVFCDLETQGGGWTYIINRIDGSQDFYLEWADYKLGFGKISGEHWLGLDHLYELTNSEPHELLFELVNGNLITFHALYDDFKIGPEADGYPIVTLGSYSGDAEDAFSYHRGMKFSTKDRDQDERPTVHCAESWLGAWWYKSCIQAHLTGTHKNGGVTPITLSWTYLSNLEEARMMIRPRSA